MEIAPSYRYFPLYAALRLLIPSPPSPFLSRSHHTTYSHHFCCFHPATAAAATTTTTTTATTAAATTAATTAATAATAAAAFPLHELEPACSAAEHAPGVCPDGPVPHSGGWGEQRTGGWQEDSW